MARAALRSDWTATCRRQLPQTVIVSSISAAGRPALDEPWDVAVCRHGRNLSRGATDCGFGRNGLRRRIANYKCVSMVGAPTSCAVNWAAGSARACGGCRTRSGTERGCGTGSRLLHRCAPSTRNFDRYGRKRTVPERRLIHRRGSAEGRCGTRLIRPIRVWLRTEPSEAAPISAAGCGHAGRVRPEYRSRF